MGPVASVPWVLGVSFYAAAMPLQRQSEDEGQIGPTRIITRPMRMLIGKRRIICPSHVCNRFQEKRYTPAPRPIYVEPRSEMAPCVRPLRHDATHPSSPWDQAPPRLPASFSVGAQLGWHHLVHVLRTESPWPPPSAADDSTRPCLGLKLSCFHTCCVRPRSRFVRACC